MATRANDDREHRLQPVRWPLARRGLLPRVAAVAALLLAAVALFRPGGHRDGPPVACPDRRPPATASPAPPPVGAPLPGDALSPERAPVPTGPIRLPGGTVGVAVTPADPAILGVLRPGDRVDLLAVRPGGEPTTVATGALVMATPGRADAVGGALYLALAPERARDIVGLPGSARFAVLVRP